MAAFAKKAGISAFRRSPGTIISVMQGRGKCRQRIRFAGRCAMQLYLPIADLPVNIFLILAMGAAVGFVSGMFGIGGGFLMTPLLIFTCMRPAVSVPPVGSHIAASSFSGAISYWRRRAIDPALAAVLLIGGGSGTALGVTTLPYLRSLGQLDLMIALSYVVLLTTVGAAMLWEGLRAILRTRRGAATPRPHPNCGTAQTQ